MDLTQMASPDPAAALPVSAATDLTAALASLAAAPEALDGRPARPGLRLGGEETEDQLGEEGFVVPCLAHPPEVGEAGLDRPRQQ